VKAVSELFAPVSGEVTAVNTSLKERPERINSDPHGSWVIAVRLSNPSELSQLLDNTQYTELVK
jgi:glycine cleavage system H protein